MLSRLLVFLFVCSISFFSSTVNAQEGVKITNDETSYGDWTVRCSKREGSSKKCIMQQQSFVTTTKQRLLEVSLNKLNDKDKRTIITFSLPLGSYLPAGMQLYFDDVREKSVPFIYCDQAGCFIKMILDEPLRKKINTSEKLSVVITSAQDRSKPIQIPFSNKGFKKALSKLK